MRSTILLMCAFLWAGLVQGAQWKLAWADEFNTNGLPDSSKWTYEEGFVRNQENQYYTRGRAQNARVENGMLIIDARKEQFPNARYQAGSDNWQQKQFAEYTSASVTTEGKASWRYGRIEVTGRRRRWTSRRLLGRQQRH